MKEEIIEMAMQAGLYSGNPRTPSTGRMIEKRLEAFAKLVAEAEKERIAKKIEQLPFGDTAQSFAIWVRNDT